MFEVLDAKRVGRQGMNEMLTKENMEQWMKQFALYRIELEWGATETHDIWLQSHEG